MSRAQVEPKRSPSQQRVYGREVELIAERSSVVITTIITGSLRKTARKLRKHSRPQSEPKAEVRPTRSCDALMPRRAAMQSEAALLLTPRRAVAALTRPLVELVPASNADACQAGSHLKTSRT